MRSLGQPPHHIFGPDNRHDKAFRVPVQRRTDHQPPRLQQLLASDQIGLRVRDMLDHFHVQHHIECLAVRCELFCGDGAIIYFHAGLGGVGAGNANVFGMEIGQFFHDAVSAVQAGVAKPDAKIFNLAIDKTGFQAHEILHVGDDAHLDAKAALQLGLHTVWVNRPQQDWPFTDFAQPISVPDMAALCDLLEC